MATQPEIPTDEEVLAIIQAVEGGVTPSVLLRELVEAGHTRENTIRAIQRVFDRGLVDLADGGRLVEAQTRAAA